LSSSLSSLSPKFHSWKDSDKVFLKLNFEFVEEENNIRYYQDPDDAIQTLQKYSRLARPYIDDKLNHIGFSYKVYRWLLIS
jgi:hypothetical protein